MDDLSAIVRYFRSFAEKREIEFGLTFGEQIIIVFLSKHDKVNQDSISKKYMIDKAMVAKTLTKLEEKGFILREQNADNKRENLISLTSKGAAARDSISTIIDEWNEIIYEGMSHEDIACFKRLTGKMAENIVNHLGKE